MERTFVGEFVFDSQTKFDAINGILETQTGPKVLHQYAGVLIKKDGFLGPTYYLNKRPSKETDKVYENRVGLFAGKRDIEKEETYKACAKREIWEEMRLDINEKELDDIMVLQSWDSAGNTNVGHIFIKRFGFFDREPNRSRIRKHMQSENRKGENVGDLRVVKRWFWRFFSWKIFLPLDWSRYTPEAIYALIHDFDVAISDSPFRNRTKKSGG